MKQQGHKHITLDKTYSIIVWWEKTRYGFRHLAILQKNGMDVHRTKACYYNRTWESYQYQSVIHKLLDGYFSDADAERYKKIADGGGEEKSVGVDADLAPLRQVGELANLGKLFSDTPEQEVAWKKRMLLTLPGIELPDDFDSLPVEEQLKRLDKALELARS